MRCATALDHHHGAVRRGSSHRTGVQCRGEGGERRKNGRDGCRSCLHEGLPKQGVAGELSRENEATHDGRGLHPVANGHDAHGPPSGENGGIVIVDARSHGFRASSTPGRARSIVDITESHAVCGSLATHVRAAETHCGTDHAGIDSRYASAAAARWVRWGEGTWHRGPDLRYRTTDRGDSSATARGRCRRPERIDLPHHAAEADVAHSGIDHLGSARGGPVSHAVAVGTEE